MLTDCKIVGRDINETFCLLLFNFVLFPSICLGLFIRHFLISFNLFFLHCPSWFLLLITLSLLHIVMDVTIYHKGWNLSTQYYFFFCGIVDIVVACDTENPPILSLQGSLSIITSERLWMGLTCVLKWPCSPGTFSFMEKWKAPAMERCVSFTATTLLGAMSRCVLCIISA